MPRSSPGSSSTSRARASYSGRGSRASNEKSAKAYAAEILAEEKKGLPLDELASRVLAAGYKSNAGDFKNVLYQSLYSSRRAGKVFDFDENSGRWILR